MISQEKFTTITDVVIDKLEGGYYHPKMLADGRVRDSRYANSGETMFGIDRKAGAGLAVYPEWSVFWAKIDSLNASNNWGWNYRGGQYEDELKELAGRTMYQEYKKLYAKYLSNESQQIVDSDPRLTFNFAYAAWNGSGWFQRFARDFNDAVQRGERNTDVLLDIAIQSRTGSSNSLIAQGGRKIQGFINNIQFLEFYAANKKTINYAIIGVVIIALTGYVYYLKKKR